MLLPDVEDCLGDYVCIARGTSGPIYNTHLFPDGLDALVDDFASSSRSRMYEVTQHYDLMLGAEFSYGACEPESEFMPWKELIEIYFHDEHPALETGYPICAKTAFDNQMYVLQFTSWQTGGFTTYTKTRITFDDKPTILLNGMETQYVLEGKDYIYEGAVAIDAQDGIVDIVVGGDIVNPLIPGTYIITFDATDSDGNMADTVYRTVIVGNLELVTMHYDDDPYCLTDTICIKRDLHGPIYNTSLFEGTMYDTFGGASTEIKNHVKENDVLEGLLFSPEPCDTAVDFMTFGEMVFNVFNQGAGDLPDYIVCVKAIETRELFEIDFLYWARGEYDPLRTIFYITWLGIPETPEIVLLGDEEMFVYTGQDYVEPGVIVLDDVEVPYEVIITGTVDVNTDGTYILQYDYTDEDGNVAISRYRTVHVGTTFTITLEAHMNMDCLTPTVCIARGEEGPIYNALIYPYGFDGLYPYQEHALFDYMEGIEFSRTTCELATSFAPFNQVYGGGIGSTITTETLCGRTIAENMYFEFDFTTWTQTSGTGIRAVYTRTFMGIPATPVINLVGHDRLYVQTGSVFVDPGVIVVDDKDTLTATAVGEVYTTYPGLYVIQYDVTDTDGNIAETVYRTVLVGEVVHVDFNYGDPPDCLTPTVCLARDLYGPLYNTLEYPQGIVMFANVNGMNVSDVLYVYGTINNATFSASTYDQAVTFSSFATVNPILWNGSEYLTVMTDAEGRMFEIRFIMWETGIYGEGPGFTYERIEIIP